MVAGIAAGSSARYPGVSPTAPIIGVRAVDGLGRSRIADVLAAADWIHKNRVSKRIGVVNFSLRSTHPAYGFYDPINLAVERLWHSGIVVVASAGNDGPGPDALRAGQRPVRDHRGCRRPRRHGDRRRRLRGAWSSRGYTAEGFAKPELAAPGRHIVAAVPPDSLLARTFPRARRLARLHVDVGHVVRRARGRRRGGPDPRAPSRLDA